MKKKNFWILLLFILASELFGSLGSIATIPNIPVWFKGLTKPPLSPPNWIFAPVWTILFALMGAAAYLVWQAEKKEKIVKMAFLWFSGQFILNILWSFLFFGARSPVAGLVCIAALLVFIVLTIQAFLKVNKIAGYFLIPYFLWVSFATYLNAAIFILN